MSKQAKGVFEVEMMKRIAAFAALLLITHLSSLIIVSAAFMDPGLGVRPMGMGGAFLAVADDANAVVYNPAGMTRVKAVEASFMSSRLFTGLEGVDIGLNDFTYVHPMGDAAGTVGLAWSYLFVPDVYREDVVGFSYGHTLDGLPGTSAIDASLGATVKYLRHEYTLDMRTAPERDPVFASGSGKGAIAVDGGAWVGIPGSGWSFAIVARNINSPDVGLQAADPVPPEQAVGIAYYSDFFELLEMPGFTFAADYISREGRQEYKAGVETRLFSRRLAIRAGAQRSEADAGLGYEFDIGQGRKLAIDYAFAWPFEIERSIGSHRLGILLRFP